MTGVNTNKPKVTKDAKSKTPKLRYVIGTSEKYYEPAENMVPEYESRHKDPSKYKDGRNVVEKITDMFLNPATSLLETQGKSLKGMFKTANELKFCGFVTAGDASIALDDSDVEETHKEAKASAENKEIHRAIDAKGLIDLF